MTFGDNLNSEVRQTLQEQWCTSGIRSVPESTDLELGNDAVTLEGVFFYADLNESTSLVDTMMPSFAAEVYKCFLVCAARIVQLGAGTVTAYDGDRIMAVFRSRARYGNAVRAALKLNYAVQSIINPAITELYPRNRYSLTHTVGIDASELFVARTGIRQANDLVWVGRAANHAAKLSARRGPPTQITAEVYDRLDERHRVGSDGRNMWIPATASEIGGRRIYSSTWRWRV